MTFVDDLPAELIARILQETFGPVPDFRGRRLFRRLRKVSPRWRGICYSSLHLWTSLRIDTDHDVPCSPQMIGWFARAGPLLPLTLALSDTSRYYEEDRGRIFAFIRENSCRWSDLALSLHESSFRALFGFGTDARQSELVSGTSVERQGAGTPSFANLTKLDIGMSEHTKWLPHWDFFTPILMPALQELTLRIPTITHAPSRRFQWQNITSLTLICSLPGGGSLAFLSETFPNLTSFHLSLHHPASYVDDCQLILLPFLETLSLHSPGGQRACKALDSLSCPALRHLEVDLTYPLRMEYDGNELADSIVKLTDRSNTKQGLCSLTIKMDEATVQRNGDATATLLAELHNCLEDVVIPWWPFTEDTIPTATPFLPRVRSISIGDIGTGIKTAWSSPTSIPATEACLFNFLMKWAGRALQKGGTLKKVALSRGSISRYVDNRVINALESMGVEIYLKE
ncbi:hypothetical protein BKA70DRAFT_1291184 [Coprinopsis sp. MPI-PUGE-AT-0042]|nr:hypothetical protein BKA70DRAFT_1291184 [Coprinopsis sp. MPI-PUGE-AT-0042]